MSDPYQPDEERSPEDVVRAMLAKLPSDIILKSTIDGSEIQVQRAILAARSDTFDSMLYGPFAESSKSVIKANYGGEVLDSLVKYICYTGDIPLLSANIGALVTTAGGTNYEELQQRVTEIAALIDASTYYALPGLSKKAIEYAIDEILRPVPTTTVFWLAQCEVHAGLTDSSLEKTALEVICKDPYMLLDEKVKPIVGMLSSSKIETILQDCDRDAISHKSSDGDPTPDSIAFNDSTIFNILRVWASDNADDEGMKNKAKELTGKFVDVKLVDTKSLSSILAESSWMVSEDELSKASDQLARDARVIAFNSNQEKICESPHYLCETRKLFTSDDYYSYRAIYAMYESGNLNLVITAFLQQIRVAGVRGLFKLLNAPWGTVEKLLKEAEVVVLSRLHSDDKRVVAKAEKELKVCLKFWIQMIVEEAPGHVSRHVSLLRYDPDRVARHFLVPVKIVGEVSSELISMLLQETTTRA